MTDRPRYNDLTKRLRLAIRNRSEIRNGYIFKRDGEALSFPQIADWISMERLCCPFLNFQLSMRRILVDAARARVSAKRSGDAPPLDYSEAINLDEIAGGASQRSAEVLALDQALEDLARVDAPKARIIELRFFGGLSVEETAEVLQISPQSVMRDWKLARTCLVRELG